MNKHLKSVFNVILLGLEKAGIDYWVYAGVAIAGIHGAFFRKNDDVDIFVKETDFEKSILILKKLCNNQSNLDFKKRVGEDLKKEHYKRPVWEIANIKSRKEIFSIVPAYVEGNIVKLIFANGVKESSNRILEKVEINMSGYRFFTPPHEDIKEIFLYCFRNRRNWKTRDDIRKDAKIILSLDEYDKYFHNNIDEIEKEKKIEL